ncbi:uncharacterized protein LOC123989263 [Osmia bicornis bicornis]|uniref:uncharacterized protein LOC123989263 n=1 Tax=Osmia bicornis bicornis TaxID=1437191 RepID=UPI001EAF2EC8|nr:uncharacterized protein LOC123989263 [Osmia bicornis bicornis]
MSSNPEEYITRDDSEIGNDYDSSASMNNVYQFAPLSSDSDEDTDNIINNRLAGRKSINRKRPRLLSTSSEEEDSNLSPNIENCDQTGRLLWSKNNLSPTLHIFDEHNSGVKGYLNAQSTPLDAFQIYPFHNRSRHTKICALTKVFCYTKVDVILNSLYHTGRKTDINENNTAIGISGNVVMTLLQPDLEKGHTLITDNWYKSPRLFTLLHQHKTNAFGTVRKNRSEMPHMEENLKRGEICYRSTNILLAMKWRDKKDVWILSSVHAARLIETPKKRLSYRVK